MIALLTLLSYLRDVSYYIDAALALALLSFTATLVAARHVRAEGRSDGTILDVAGVALLVLGLLLATIGLYGLLRMPDIFHQLHAAGLVTGPAIILILLAAVATGAPRSSPAGAPHPLLVDHLPAAVPPPARAARPGAPAGQTQKAPAPTARANATGRDGADRGCANGQVGSS